MFDMEKELARVEEAKSKYVHEWWNSDRAIDMAWGQLNEPVEIIDGRLLLSVLNHVLSRNVSGAELQDRAKLRGEVRRVGRNMGVDLNEIIRKK